MGYRIPEVLLKSRGEKVTHTEAQKLDEKFSRMKHLLPKNEVLHSGICRIRNRIYLLPLTPHPTNLDNAAIVVALLAFKRD